ncbi:MAG TPA: VirK family protein [Fimbriimonadaceae bacterium]|nr:VirK family protein [Fimbriimonadaceae bacterium]
MKRLPVVTLLLFGMLSWTLADTRRLTTFPAMMDALKQGKVVHLVVEYAKCKLKVDGEEVKAPDAIGGMKLETWEYFAKGVIRNDRAYVASSETVLIAHPRHGHVFNYVRVRLYEDGKVEITARYLKTGTYEVVMDETFTGEISGGKDDKAVSLFVAN